MNKSLHIVLSSIMALSLLSGCERSVTVELPPYEQQVVIEGRIEQGDYPLLIITRTQGYYDPVNAATFSNLFVTNADARIVVNGKDTVMLDRICTTDLPDSLKILVAQLLNLPTENSMVNICIYTSLNPLLLGAPGSAYELLVKADGHNISSVTNIPEPVKLDTLYFKPDGGLDTLGFLYAKFQEPPQPGNAYRWFAQRINHYLYGPEAGEIKDINFVPPYQSAFDDEFFNGEPVDFGYNRGRIARSTKTDDINEERGYFKLGDTIVVKFTTIDRGVFRYYRSYYNSIGSSGSPFASPANVVSNVTGAVGVWAGYGISLDTVIAK